MSVYLLANHVVFRFLIRISSRFLAEVEITRQGRIRNTEIETYVEICKVRGTSKVSNVDVHTMNSSEHREYNLYIMETSVEYPKEDVSNQVWITAPPKGNESR